MRSQTLPVHRAPVERRIEEGGLRVVHLKEAGDVRAGAERGRR